MHQSMQITHGLLRSACCLDYPVYTPLRPPPEKITHITVLTLNLLWDDQRVGLFLNFTL